ncbi:iron complex outermembrane recepter protein [Hymenobacter daecheongensis DSM 21074]|uniref:Iron complex outermembrane recepter protein n=1 Tax=Hymenobacter daecheongensis DSM 21074 TaxID=1121955 RepID=A0A1M6ADC1_9BACT|nr:TonB-dependent receptor [Hymenobacter daecheongensis]SHI34397.1 iron complex outermembrane recepter protein [Hymenobacter daecheongensis DSM 21074]
MSRFFLAAACFVLTTGAWAQTTPVRPARPARVAAAPITGRVIDETTKEPLPGATVLFPDLKQATATGPDGTFRFSSLPRGRFLMQVRFVGYTTVVRTVDTGTPQALEVALGVAATEIGQVVVTGVSASTELRRSPVPTTVVDRTQLNQSAATNAVDAIAHTPGLSQITTGAGISKPVIRGLGSNRVITLNNGAKQEGQQWGDEHGIEIDEYAIDRAEIIKGPGSLLYGSDGMAGVINFMAPEPVEEGKTLAALAANYQTNNHLQGYSVMNAGNRNGLNWLVRGSSKVAGNYHNRYDGRVYNSGFRELDGNGYVGVNKSWGYSHLTFSSFNQRVGLVEGDRDEATGRFLKQTVSGDSVLGVPVTRADLRGYGLAVPRQQINHLRIGTDNNFILGQSRLTVNVGGQQNLRREFGNALDPQETSLFFQLRTLDYAVRYYLPERNGWNLTLGTSGMAQQNVNRGVEFLIPAYRLFDNGVFAVVKKSFGRLDLSGGLREDVRTISGDALYLDADERPTDVESGEQKFGGFRRTFRNVSGSVGGSFGATERLVLKANVSRGFRAPNIAELASNGKHEGTIRYELGETSLRAETSLQLDGGLSYTTDHISLSLDAFRNGIRNYIFPARLGDSLSTEGDPVFRYGQGQARLTGGEISLDLHPHPLDWLHFENSFSLVRAVQLNQPEGQRNLPFIPADRLQSELRVNFRRAASSRLGHLYARGGVEHTFAQNRFFSAFDTETRTAGYTLVNVGLGSDVLSAAGKTLFSVYLAGNNLFDVGYQSHLSRLKYAAFNAANGRTGVFNQGRNVSVKLLVPLSF